MKLYKKQLFAEPKELLVFLEKTTKKQFDPADPKNCPVAAFLKSKIRHILAISSVNLTIYGQDGGVRQGMSRKYTQDYAIPQWMTEVQRAFFQARPYHQPLTIELAIKCIKGFIAKEKEKKKGEYSV